MDWKSAALLLAVVVCISGCGPTSDDPRHGGLMGGLQGVYGGGYDKRLQEMNQQLVSHQRLHQDLEVQSVALTKEHQLIDAKLVAEEQQMVALEQMVHSLEDQVAGQREQSYQHQKETLNLKSKILKLQKKIQDQHAAIDNLDRSGGSAADPERYQALREGRDQLGQEYKDLLQQNKVLDP